MNIKMKIKYLQQKKIIVFGYILEKDIWKFVNLIQKPEGKK